MDLLPDSFADVARATRSHIPAINTPAMIESSAPPIATAAPRQKRGRPPGAKDRHPRQRRTTSQNTGLPTTAAVADPGEHEEIAIHYNQTGHIWNRSEVHMNDAFVAHIANTLEEDLPDPSSIREAKQQPDWPQWELAIHSEIDSLISREVFGPIRPAQPHEELTGYRFTFVKKRNAAREVIRHKARLVARGFTQIPGRDYDLTYAPVMDIITYRYLVAFSLQHKLCMHQLDIVTTYLYGTLEHVIHMEAPPELIQRILHHTQGEQVPTSNRATREQFGHTDKHVLRSTSHAIIGNTILREHSNHKDIQAQGKFAVKILRSMYGLKQSGRTWFHKFKTEMLKMGFTTSDLAPCIFLKREVHKFLIIAIYVDDLNLFGTAKIIHEYIQILKQVFEMRDLGRTTFCLGLQFDYIADGILLHQTTYTKRILRQFNMDKAKPVTSPMDLRSLDSKKDLFRKREEGEPLLGSEKPYLSIIGALMFLAT
jgi:hypothetical protein